MSEGAARRDRWLGALLLWGPFAVLAVRGWQSSPDDAFITMRYARNLLHGHGPVFNPGEHVEGFTSPLHVLVAAATQLLPGGHDLFKLKVASLVAAIGGLAVAARLLDAAVDGRVGRLLGRFALGASTILLLTASNGLETSLAFLVITAFLLVEVRAAGDGPHPRPVPHGLLALACVLVRPEALGIVLAALALALVRGRRAGDLAGARWAVTTLVGLVAVQAFRVLYYGAWLPNTAATKRPALDVAVPDGWQYLVSAVSGPALATVVVVAALVAGTARIVLVERRLAILPLAVAGQAAFVLLAGGDWMPGARFVAPVLAALVVVQVVGVAWPSPDHGWVARAAAAALAVAVLAVAAGGWGAGRWPSRGLDDHALVAVQGEVWAAGPRILRCARPGWTVAYGEMGYGPWVRDDLRFIDYRGLVDDQVAGLVPANYRHTWGIGDPVWHPSPNPVARYLLDRNPEVIITQDPPETAGELTTDYRLADRWSATDGDQASVYLRRDLSCRR